MSDHHATPPFGLFQLLLPFGRTTALLAAGQNGGPRTGRQRDFLNQGNQQDLQISPKLCHVGGSSRITLYLLRLTPGRMAICLHAKGSLPIGDEDIR
jgi:hypothetical protein